MLQFFSTKCFQAKLLLRKYERNTCVAGDTDHQPIIKSTDV